MNVILQHKIILNTLFLFLFSFGNFVYSKDLPEIITDFENIWIIGKRPLSLGVDYYINEIGALMATGNCTDFAIEGAKGFFVLFDKDKNDILMTRNGSFQFNILGYLINHDGYYVLKNTSDLSKHIYDFLRFTDLFDSDFNLIMTDIFLVILPLSNSVKYITPEYIKADDYHIVASSTRKIVNRFLETTPVNFNLLLSKFIENAKISVEYKEFKNEILEIINKRFKEYYEMKMICEDSYKLIMLQIHEINELFEEKI